MRLLSKSKLMEFRQCPKRLWLSIHRPELSEDSVCAQARFRVGFQRAERQRRPGSYRCILSTAWRGPNNFQHFAPMENSARIFY